jgi:hypothetical protein
MTVVNRRLAVTESKVMFEVVDASEKNALKLRK